MDIMRIGSCELPYPGMMPTKRKRSGTNSPKGDRSSPCSIRHFHHCRPVEGRLACWGPLYFLHLSLTIAASRPRYDISQAWSVGGYMFSCSLLHLLLVSTSCKNLTAISCQNLLLQVFRTYLLQVIQKLVCYKYSGACLLHYFLSVNHIHAAGQCLELSV